MPRQENHIQMKDLAAGGFHALLDVRSPGEFAEDHLPGALSVPVLDDAERAWGRFGTYDIDADEA